MISQKKRHILPVLYNMARAEIKISLHLILKVVVADATGDAFVTAVAAKGVATTEEAEGGV